MANFCFDYNPTNEHQVTGHRIILYPCHGMGQNQVRFMLYFHFDQHYGCNVKKCGTGIAVGLREYVATVR